MKTILGFGMAVLLAIGCGHVNSSNDDNTIKSSSAASANVLISLSLAEAESILGEQARLTDSSFKAGKTVSTISLTYTAKNKEEKTGKTGNLYYMLEDFKADSSAISNYESIKSANENHEGIKVLDSVGDEAYFHSDGENFCFILARKGNHLLRMKVNKLTGKTSLAEFNGVAKKLMDSF